MTLRWRTDGTSTGRVLYGLSPGSTTWQAVEATPGTDHTLTLTGLNSNTTYYYTIVTPTTTLAGGDASHFFVTPPVPGTAKSTRIWILGDPGTADTSARAVRDAYYNFTGTRPTDLWLMLGDNAYEAGTEAEYQDAVFGTYPTMLQNSVLWPTFGNHDAASADATTGTGPYFDIFTLPKSGEAGGVASGTEAYYSFDYANIHFISLDSSQSNRAVNGPMLTWLQADLASTTQRWIIAFFHHPPYSKGSHDSDTETNLREMRENAVPILEAGGVDLVLTGHSHAYERSFLIDGHYGLSTTFNSSMQKDGGGGRVEDSGTYVKRSLVPTPHEGAAYVVAGTSGVISPGALNHPAMYTSALSLGSLVLDVNGDRLDLMFLSDTGAQLDHFSIVKGDPTAAPGTPTGLNAAVVSDTQVHLGWTAVSAANSYRVERSSTGGSDWVIAAPTVTATSFNDSGLTGSTTYSYRVISANGIGESAPTGSVNATTTASPLPGVPTGLSATANSDTAIALTWTAVSGATHYDVERSLDNGASWSAAGTIATASFTDTGLTPSTTYTYHVRAGNGTGSSAYSSPASATTQAAIPGVPTGLSATANSDTAIAVTWTAVSGATHYDVERSLDNGASWNAAGTTATASFTDTGLTPSTTYTYHVRAGNGTGSSAYSSPASATTQPSVPPAPTGLTATVVSATQINLAWADGTGETGYRVERSTDGVTWTAVGTTGANVTTFSNTGLTAATTYRYRVFATNSAGSSAPSATVTATTVPNAPGGVKASVISTTQINVSWNDVSGETGYRIERSTGGGVWVQVGTAGANVKTFSDTGLSSGTTYSYRVFATNVGGSSPPSNTVTAKTRLDAPGGFTATAVSSTQINLAWSDVNGETGYRIDRSTNGGSTWTTIANVGANVTTFSNTGLSTSTAYAYRLFATDSSTTSAASATVSATTLADTINPTTPGTLTATGGTKKIALSWGASSDSGGSGLAGYQVWQSPSGAAGTFTLLTTVTGTSFTNSGLASGQKFWYYVVAIDRAGNTSGPSNTASATAK
jgi:fibronectin type 3 domain-containing protein